MNFDDIITTSNKVEEKNYESKPFNKEEWAKKKQEEKANAYELIDKTASEIVTDSKTFTQYLNTQAKFNKYSVGNALLITAQMPNATQIRDYDSWKESGAYINKKAKGITILEPGDSYTREDGTTSVSFNPKKVFDITQTNAKQKEQRNNYDDELIVKAFLHESPVDFKVVDDLANGKGAEWNKEDNVLYIRKGLGAPTIFHSISKEYAKIGLQTTGNQELDNFKSNCASYLICKKYNIDVSSFNFDNLPQALKNMDASEIRNTLGDIRGAMEDINSRMSNCFESMSKTQKNKEYER